VSPVAGMTDPRVAGGPSGYGDVWRLWSDSYDEVLTVSFTDARKNGIREAGIATQVEAQSVRSRSGGGGDDHAD
jgi:hypothetical protein